MGGGGYKYPYPNLSGSLGNRSYLHLSLGSLNGGVSLRSLCGGEHRSHSRKHRLSVRVDVEDLPLLLAEDGTDGHGRMRASAGTHT